MASMEQIAGPELIGEHWLVTCNLWGPIEGGGYFWFVDVTYLDPKREVARREDEHCRFAFVRSPEEARKQAKQWRSGVKTLLGPFSDVSRR